MIAVTGANGLLGSFILRQLSAAKLPFVALKRKDSDVSLVSELGSLVEWRDADIMDPVGLEEGLKGVTHVIHAAAVVSFNPAHKRKLFDVNVMGTRNVVNACLSGNVKKLIHISSVAALGRVKGQEIINEASKWVDSPLNTTYGESKYLAELEVFRGHEEGLDVCIVNPSVILAPADWTKSSAKLFRYVWKENRFYIDNDLNYVDVRDVADVIVRLVNFHCNGERFVLSAGRLPIRDFFSKVAARFSKRPPSVKVSPSALKILAFFEGVRCYLSGAEPLITRETARLANTHFYYSNEKVTRQLKFQFKSVEDTLDWCCKYYIHQPLAKK